MAATSTVPTRCIERYPTIKTFVFAGVPVSLALIARSYEPHLDIAYLSRVFARRKTVGLRWAKLISEGLGMTLQAFLDEVEGQPAKKWQHTERDVNQGRHLGAKPRHISAITDRSPAI